MSKKCIFASHFKINIRISKINKSFNLHGGFMLKKLFYVSIIALAFVACNNSTQTNQEQEAAEIAVITVEDFSSNPDNFVGEEIIINGTIVHVCQHGGKRMFIIGEDPDERLQIKAGDDATFAVELEGSDVAITGLVDELRIDEAYLTEWENELKADNPESELKIHRGEEGHEHHEDDDPSAEYEQIENYRTQLTEQGVDHLSFYSIIAIEYQEKNN